MKRESLVKRSDKMGEKYNEEVDRENRARKQRNVRVMKVERKQIENGMKKSGEKLERESVVRLQGEKVESENSEKKWIEDVQ